MSRDELILLVTAEFNGNPNSRYTTEQDLLLRDTLTRLEDTTGFVIFEFKHLLMISTLVQKETRRVTSLNIFSF